MSAVAWNNGRVYVPLAFRLDDDEAWRVVRDAGAGMLVVNTEEGLVSVFVPVVVSDDRRTIVSHLARANPWWKSVRSGDEVLGLFVAASSYVSPSYYPSRFEQPGVVPTWNYVAVHAHGASGIKDAIRAGVDTVEHVSLADEEAIALAKQHGTYFSMDIYNDDYILAEGARNGAYPESLEKEKQIGRRQRETFKAATAAGVRMVFGTDGGVYPNGDNAKQFATMVEWGMTPLQAIRAATSVAAEALGRTGDVGAIAVGRYGDLIGVTGDPLADVRRLEAVAFVMKGGTIVVAPGALHTQPK